MSFSDPKLTLLLATCREYILKKRGHLAKCFQTGESLILDMVNQLLSQQIYTIYSVLLSQLNLTKKKVVAMS